MSNPGNRKIPKKFKGRWVQVAECAVDAGWTIKPTKSGHYAWKSPDTTQAVVFSPGTPSDHASLDRVIMKLRRSGLVYRRNREVKD
jgi:hypothetical protein